jgi:hypothetical protein
MHEHMPGSLENEWNRRGVCPIEISRIRHAVYFGATHVLGAAAVDHVAEVREIAAKIIVSGKARRAFSARDPRCKNHLLTDVNRGDLRTYLRDFPGDVASRYVRKRYGDAREAAANPKVEIVQGAGMHAHEHLSRPQMRFGNIRVAQNTWMAVLVDYNRFHRKPPWTRTGTLLTTLQYIS